MQDQVNATLKPKRVPWNKGKLTGAKPPLRSKQVCRSGQSSRLSTALVTSPCSIWQSTASLVVATWRMNGRFAPGSGHSRGRTVLCCQHATYPLQGLARLGSCVRGPQATRLQPQGRPAGPSPAGGTPPRPAERRPAASRREAAGLFPCFVSSLAPKPCELRLSVVRRLTFRVWPSRRTHLAKRA
jgi:hypothetical protein